MIGQTGWDRHNGTDRMGQTGWDRQTDRVGQTDRQSGTDRQTEWDRQTDRVGQTDRQSGTDRSLIISQSHLSGIVWNRSLTPFRWPASSR
jgi:hypothetical protein